MTEPLHAARRRRDRGAAAVLTVRPLRTVPADEARRRAMSGHPAGRARLAPVVAFPSERTALR